MGSVGEGALSEGAAMAGTDDSADSPFGDRVPPLRGRPSAAGTLDLAAALDEPEQLIRYLIVAAQEHIGFSENSDKWKILLGHVASAAKELEKLNQPRPRSAVAPSS